MKLKVILKSDNKIPGRKRYDTEVNAENYKEISLVLTDLKMNGVAIDKGIKDYQNKDKSDWEISLGI